jgi:hypothetical protein
MRFAIISGRMGKAEFRRKYPKAEATAMLFDGAYDGVWLTQDEVMVAEFYRVEEMPDTLELLSNGETRLKSDKKPLPFGVYATGKTRPTTRRTQQPARAAQCCTTKATASHAADSEPASNPSNHEHPGTDQPSACGK